MAVKRGRTGLDEVFEALTTAKGVLESGDFGGGHGPEVGGAHDFKISAEISWRRSSCRPWFLEQRQARENSDQRFNANQLYHGHSPQEGIGETEGQEADEDEGSREVGRTEEEDDEDEEILDGIRRHHDAEIRASSLLPVGVAGGVGLGSSEQT